VIIFHAKMAAGGFFVVYKSPQDTLCRSPTPPISHLLSSPGTSHTQQTFHTMSVLSTHRLVGKTAVITGASGGIGAVSEFTA
jgi:hypothetical protein